MNLKEAFRYQKFLENMMGEARTTLLANAMSITEKHMKSAANPEAADTVEVGDEYGHKPSDIVAFMVRLVKEREKLTHAISCAKQFAMPEFTDIDAALEANKFRRTVKMAIDSLLMKKEGTIKKTGYDYKMNADGNQIQYLYPVEAVHEYNFDKEEMKDMAKAVAGELDKASVDIECGLVNASVDYDTVFDVNGTLEDALEVFVALSDK